MNSLLLCLAMLTQLRLPPPTPPVSIADHYPGDGRDRELAARYAPVWRARFTNDPANARYDYITNFDFDGDWIGNNNWEHAADAAFPMKAYVYYSVIESRNYYFITYADYHARDWSLLQPLMDGGMDKVQASDRFSQWLPKDVRDQIEVNHENDLEGVQVIVAKSPRQRVLGVETIAHNRFERYLPSELTFQGDHVELYVESQKHGVHKYPYQVTSRLGALFDSQSGPMRAYHYTGIATDPAKQETGDIGYDLLPIYSTFWKRALASVEADDTFGETIDYSESFCRSYHGRAPCKLTRIGTALRGDYAGKNRANLPWGWSSTEDRQLNNGVWFFDPAQIIAAHFPRDAPAGEYVSNPYLSVTR